MWCVYIYVLHAGWQNKGLQNKAIQSVKLDFLCIWLLHSILPPLIQRRQPEEIEIREAINFASRSTLLNHQRWSKNAKNASTFFKFFAKIGQMSINLGDLVTHVGDREIRSVSQRLPDIPGELA